jgi:Transposase zinc-binding domain
MRTIPDIFPPSASEDSERYPHLPASHHKALDAICRCRTGAYGSRLSACQRWPPPHDIAQACGHRPWPQCQQHQAVQWLPNQLATQLPGPSFLLTVTVPEALRPLCRSHPRLASQPLCTASSQALKRLAQAPRFVGTTLPGFPGILPPWGRHLP